MAGVTAEVARALAAGEIGAPLALMRLVLAGEAEGLRAAALADARLFPVAALAAERPRAVARLVALAEAEPDHRPAHGTDTDVHARALFERLGGVDPDLASAAYTLGDPALLAASAAEVVAVADTWAGVRGTRVLDLGCGSGRNAAALLDRGAAFVLGADVSPAMLKGARARLAGRPGAVLAQVDGRGLAAFAAGAFDLVLAADCFPYLTAAGPEPAAAMLAEVARVSRPGGAALIFNWSYRGDLEADRADVAAAASAAGLAVARDGERPFRLWDAAGWLLRPLSSQTVGSTGR